MSEFTKYRYIYDIPRISNTQPITRIPLNANNKPLSLNGLCFAYMQIKQGMINGPCKR